MWQFIQDEVLGMKWLNRLIGSVLSSFVKCLIINVCLDRDFLYDIICRMNSQAKGCRRIKMKE